MRFTVDDSLVRSIGVESEHFVTLLAAETVLVPPGLLSHQPLNYVRLLATNFADLVDFDWRWFGSRLEKKLKINVKIESTVLMCFVYDYDIKA